MLLNTEESQKVLDKSESEILKEYLKKNNINQSKLTKLCQDKGYFVSQGSVSKVLSGQKRMSLDECRAFCDVLNISADTMLFPEKRGTLREGAEAFFLLPEDELEAVSKFIDDYDICFKSTAKEESKILKGTMKFRIKDSSVLVDVQIFVNKATKKLYSGYLVFSKQWPVAYIILKRDMSGEMSILAFRYREFTSETMQCRIALCLTTSAGEEKNPVVHRVLMVRKALNVDVKKMQEFLNLRETVYLDEKDFQLLKTKDNISEQVVEKLQSKMVKKNVWAIEEEKSINELFEDIEMECRRNSATIIRRLSAYLNRNYFERLESEEDMDLYQSLTDIQKEDI